MTATTADSGRTGQQTVARGKRGAISRLACGAIGRPSWERPSLLLLLAAAGCLYAIGLAGSGWANGYYSAAVFAGSKNWTAMLFGSIDPANFISVDKPPAALWLPDILARLFGLNPWTVLLPQAVEGVAAVGLLYATVRRQAGALAGLLAGAVMATTPVCALMFRFNNPDALLTLLFVASAYAATRAAEDGRTRWVVLAGAVLGVAFLTKLLQALVVAPALLGTYLAVAPVGWGRKARDVGAAVAAFVCAAGWWIAIVAITPATARPYVGSSQRDSIFELIFGYNGLGRLTGQEAGVSNTTGSSFPGGDRLFRGDMANQISWLLPAATIFVIAALWSLRHSRQGTAHLAPVVMWGGWLVLAAAELSYAKGIVHPYYTIALAPAIAAAVGIGASTAWRRRRYTPARVLVGAVGVVTALWSVVPFSGAHGWNAWMRPTVVVAAVGGAVLLTRGRGFKRLHAVGGALLVASCLFLPAVWSAKTAMTPHEGADPLAGPTVGTVVLHLPTVSKEMRTRTAAGVPPASMGGLLGISRPSAAMVTALTTDAANYTWVAATVGGNNAAGLELATRKPVLALGGFNATDPAPTVAEFRRLVADHAVHYFVADDVHVGVGVSDIATRQIPDWVAAHFVVQHFDAVEVYDLTAPLPEG